MGGNSFTDLAHKFPCLPLRQMMTQSPLTDQIYNADSRYADGRRELEYCPAIKWETENKGYQKRYKLEIVVSLDYTFPKKIIVSEQQQKQQKQQQHNNARFKAADS